MSQQTLLRKNRKAPFKIKLIENTITLTIIAALNQMRYLRAELNSHGFTKGSVQVNDHTIDIQLDEDRIGEFQSLFGDSTKIHNTKDIAELDRY